MELYQPHPEAVGRTRLSSDMCAFTFAIMFIPVRNIICVNRCLMCRSFSYVAKRSQSFFCLAYVNGDLRLKYDFFVRVSSIAIYKKNLTSLFRHNFSRFRKSVQGFKFED